MHEFIGRYRVVGKLGEGAMAEVFEAEDPKIQRRIAIKLLRADTGKQKDLVDRFLREATMAGSLSHPNIVTVYDVGEVEGQPYIAMELLRGQELSDLMEQDRPMAPLEALRIIRQIASALDVAHKNGIIHRDIKPSNIFLCEKNENVQVLDFGVARIEQAGREANANLQATQVGTIIGTPRYMSPEQAKGEAVDRRSDLFSLGVILYELLTGQKTFQATTIASLMLQITQVDSKPIRQIVPTLPKGVEFIVGKLLAKDPAKRFDNAELLLKVIDREIESLIKSNEERDRDRVLPLPVKLSALMGVITLILMIVATSLVQSRMVSSLRDQLIASGVALTKIVASQSATPILGEEWFSIKAFVDEAARRDSFNYVVITDFNDIVRGASNPDLLDQTYTGRDSVAAIDQIDNVSIGRWRQGGEDLFIFEGEVLFQNQPVGRVYMGISRDPVWEVARTSRVLMILLGLVVIIAISAITFVVARLLQAPVDTLSRAMQEAARGNFAFRISHERRDEFGRLFDAFNHLAASIEGSRDGSADDVQNIAVDDAAAADVGPSDAPAGGDGSDGDGDGQDSAADEDLATEDQTATADDATIVMPAPGKDAPSKDAAGTEDQVAVDVEGEEAGLDATRVAPRKRALVD